jgi:hypothetical protein
VILIEDKARRRVPRVDATQGFAKKIDVDRLPADLTFQFADPGLRPRQFGKRSRRSCPDRRGRSAVSGLAYGSAPERRTGDRPPAIREQLTGDPEFPRNRRQTSPAPAAEPRFPESRRKYAHSLL